MLLTATHASKYELIKYVSTCVRVAASCSTKFSHTHAHYTFPRYRQHASSLIELLARHVPHILQYGANCLYVQLHMRRSAVSRARVGEMQSRA
jgi:hypothetical protein